MGTTHISNLTNQFGIEKDQNRFIKEKVISQGIRL